jgi:hypothetical protein
MVPKKEPLPFEHMTLREVLLRHKNHTPLFELHKLKMRDSIQLCPVKSGDWDDCV